MTLRLVTLTSNSRGNAARITHRLVRTRPGGVEIVGAIVDRGTRADRRRQRDRLRAWRRHGGLSYVAWRLWLEVRARLGRRPAALYAHSLHELGGEHGFEVVDVPNVNSAETEDALRRLAPDVAISLGNRVIRERIFSLPRLGTINLHHGRIPDYRGGPPAFWELLDGAATMGISVHRVDDAIDHGEILAEAEVPVLPGDDPHSLMARAHEVDYLIVEEALVALAAGRVAGRAVDHAGGRVRTIPSRSEVRALSRRLGRRVRLDDARRAPLDEIRQ